MLPIQYSGKFWTVQICINGYKAFSINFSYFQMCACVDNSTPPSKYVHAYMSIMLSFLVESMVRGYHVWKDIWDVVVGQEFSCKCKDGNRVNPFAVAVVRGDTITGHLRKISSTCSLYVCRDGSIVAA